MIGRMGAVIIAAILALYFTPATPVEKRPRRIDVSVTKDGFTPKRLTVKKGEPVTFVFTRRSDRTCAKDIVIYLDDDHTISRRLPLNQSIEVTVTFRKTGERGFSCSMKMYGAAIMVE